MLDFAVQSQLNSPGVGMEDNNNNKQPPAAHGPQNENDGADKNYDFVQISRSSFKQWGELTMSMPLASRILMILMERMGKVNNAVVCSYKTLMDLTGYSRGSVGKAIRKLKDDRWIATVKIGSATAYCVNSRVAWQASRTAKRYAIFTATVIASESEQDSKEMAVTEDLKRIPFVSTSESMSLISDPESEIPPDQMDLEING